MASTNALEITKTIIRNAAKLALEEAGSRLLGSLWPSFKTVLTPIVGELGRRFPKLFLENQVGKDETIKAAEKAVEALSTDKSLQNMLNDEFSTLKKGQAEILSEFDRVAKQLKEINVSIDRLADITEDKTKLVYRAMTSLKPVDREKEIERIGRAIGSRPEVTALIIFAVGVGEFIMEVLEKGADWQSYERVIKGIKIRISPGVRYEDDEGRTRRSFMRAEYRDGGWLEENRTACREHGRWKIAD